MSTFAIVTDSTCDLPADLARQHGIYVVPQYILWGRESLRDGIDIDSEGFYRRLASESELPKTSQPSPSDFAEVYRRAQQERGAAAILAVTISAELSGTFSSAQQAIKEVDFPVYAVDSRTASMGLGLTLLTLAEARDRGMAVMDAARLAGELAARTRVIFTLDTLEYLFKGGRIGNAQRLIGSMLNVKPLLHVEAGTIGPLGRVRTRSRALQRLPELVDEIADPDKPLRIGFLHGAASDDLPAIKAAVLDKWQPELVIEGWVCAAIGVHTGPGVLGIGLLQ